MIFWTHCKLYVNFSIALRYNFLNFMSFILWKFYLFYLYMCLIHPFDILGLFSEPPSSPNHPPPHLALINVRHVVVWLSKNLSYIWELYISYNFWKIPLVVNLLETIYFWTANFLIYEGLGKSLNFVKTLQTQVR